MSQEWWHLFANLGAAVAFVMFVALAVSYIRGTRDKNTIHVLEASNHALAERVTLLEADGTRMAARITLLEHENATLLAHRPSADVIAEMVTDLNKLRLEFASHALETSNYFRRTEAP